MAEYMDISRIDDWNDLSIIDDNGWATYVYDVGELPRANVIEREKINKAIEGAYRIRTDVLLSNSCYEPNEVLDIVDQITKLFEEI